MGWLERRRLLTGDAILNGEKLEYGATVTFSTNALACLEKNGLYLSSL